jgi:hypothetical protein
MDFPAFADRLSKFMTADARNDVHGIRNAFDQRPE